MWKPCDDPKFRALLLRREQGERPPEALWSENELVPLDGILHIHEQHRKGRITAKEWLQYVKDWTKRVQEQLPSEIQR